MFKAILFWWELQWTGWATWACSRDPARGVWYRFVVWLGWGLRFGLWKW